MYNFKHYRRELCRYIRRAFRQRKRQCVFRPKHYRRELCRYIRQHYVNVKDSLPAEMALFPLLGESEGSLDGNMAAGIRCSLVPESPKGEQYVFSKKSA